MAGGIQKGDILAVHLDAGSADVLGDAAGLAAGDVGFADGVQDGGFAVVDVAHDHHHRISGLQGGIVVLAVVDNPLLDGDHDLPLHLGVKFAGYQIGGVEVNFLVGGGHHAHHHQLFDDLGGRGLQAKGQLRHGDGIAHRDGDGFLLPLHLNPAQPLRLGFPAGMGLAILLGFLVDFLLFDRAAVPLHPVGGLRQHIELFIVPAHVDLGGTGVDGAALHRGLGLGGLFGLLLGLAGTGSLRLARGLLGGGLLPCLFGRLIPRGSGCLRGGSRLNRGRLLLRRLFGGGGEIGVKIFHLVRLGEVLEHQVQLLFLQRGHAFFRRVHILSQQLDHFLAGRSKILGNLAYAVFNHHMAVSSSKSCRQCRPMAVANPLSSVASTPTGF